MVEQVFTNQDMWAQSLWSHWVHIETADMSVLWQRLVAASITPTFLQLNGDLTEVSKV